MSNIDEMTFDGRGDRHRRRHQVGATSSSLAPLKIPITRRGTALTGLQHIGIHRETHAAAGFPPLEPCFAEDMVEPFCLRLLFDEP